MQTCKFLKTHLPNVGSGYWGGHNAVDTFHRCMRIRLAQKVVKYLKEACSDDAKRRLVLKGLAKDIETSPFFSMDELRKQAPSLCE